MQGVSYPCTLTFERFEERTATHYQKMQLHLKAFDATTGTRVAAFEGALISEKDSSSPTNPRHVYWRIYNRKVDPLLRGSGVGSACLQAYEELCQRMGQEYPLLKAEWISVSTMLTSLTRLLISQDWLKSHELSEYLRSSGSDFGYIPRPEDEQNTRAVLEAGTTELNDLDRTYAPQIELRKALV